MTIREIITAKKPSLSFEVFPPKTDASFESVQSAVLKIAELKPSYMSVTYGAGGGTSAYTVQIARSLAESGVTPLAHLSCISSDRENVRQMLNKLKENGIRNILALRGDVMPGTEIQNPDYRYATDLVREIRDFGGFCIGGACYPESHPESPDSRSDLLHLKEKVDAGCEFLTTQMFFDNNILYNFLYRAMRVGIDVPVVAGIMPVTHASQIKRICAISGSALPQSFVRIVDRYGDQAESMKQAGIAFATEQVVDLLANGINAVHIYSMNHPDVAETIYNNVRALIQ